MKCCRGKRKKFTSIFEVFLSFSVFTSVCVACVSVCDFFGNLKTHSQSCVRVCGEHMCVFC